MVSLGLSFNALLDIGAWLWAIQERGLGIVN